jgi:hypothetical protein
MVAPIGNRNAARAAVWTATVGVALHGVRPDWVRGKGQLSDLATVLAGFPGTPYVVVTDYRRRGQSRLRATELAERIDEK